LSASWIICIWSLQENVLLIRIHNSGCFFEDLLFDSLKRRRHSSFLTLSWLSVSWLGDWCLSICFELSTHRAWRLHYGSYRKGHILVLLDISFSDLISEEVWTAIHYLLQLRRLTTRLFWHCQVAPCLASSSVLQRHMPQLNTRTCSSLSSCSSLLKLLINFSWFALFGCWKHL